MKIATLQVSALFTAHGSDVQYEEGFDPDATHDYPGQGQALLVYDNGRWELLTSEEEAGISTHGYMQHKEMFEAITEAQQRLQDLDYEVGFKLKADDPD
jgi:hypothetical protein